MKQKLNALKAVLDDLGVSPDIETIDDRKRVQKAIYLSQAAGVNLGYHFGWYVMGPYSPDLTKTYYELAKFTFFGQEDVPVKDLSPDLKSKLEQIKPILNPPEGVLLKQEDWLELLASLHYLRARCNKQETQEVLKREKVHLVAFTENAEHALADAALLPN